jgi:GTP-binding protein Era
MRSGVVVLAGLPSVGKSSLVNRIIGRKLVITSPRKQTSRYAVVAIFTDDERGQIVFRDTPGLHDAALGPLNQRMHAETVEALKMADVLLEVVSPDQPDPLGRLAALDSFRGPRLRVVNKVDLIPKAGRCGHPLLQPPGEGGPAVMAVSSSTGEGIAPLVEALFALLPEGDFLYPPDDLSDRPQRFFMAEIIREKVMLFTHQEIPYASAVVVEESSWDEAGGIWRVQAVVYVEKESQKGIVIGRGGQMLKRIGQSARLGLESFLDGRVRLDLWVKVRRNWTKDQGFLRELGLNGNS